MRSALHAFCAKSSVRPAALTALGHDQAALRPRAHFADEMGS
jgi:hypothetical protein